MIELCTHMMIFIIYNVRYKGKDDYFKVNLKKMEDDYNQYLYGDMGKISSHTNTTDRSEIIQGMNNLKKVKINNARKSRKYNQNMKRP